MSQTPDYQSLLTNIIKKQIIILGPEIAVLKARGVSGLKVGNDGQVNEINGDPKAILKQLIDQYVILSGQIVHMTIEPFMTEFPDLVREIKDGV